MFTRQQELLLSVGTTVMLAIVLSLSISISTPRTVIAQEGPTSTPAEFPVTYDSFTNWKYDSGYNADLWEPASRGTTQIIQQDGVLMLANTIPSGDDGVILNLNNWSEPVFDFFEARMWISQSKSHGTNGVLTLTVYVNEKLDDAAPTIIERKWVQIGLNYLANGATIWASELDDTPPQITDWIKYDTWYTVRIEFDEKNNSLVLFWDDVIFTTISIDDIVRTMPKTSSLQLVPTIQLWHDPDTALTAYLDYVRIAR